MRFGSDARHYPAPSSCRCVRKCGTGRSTRAHHRGFPRTVLSTAPRLRPGRSPARRPAALQRVTQTRAMATRCTYPTGMAAALSDFDRWSTSIWPRRRTMEPTLNTVPLLRRQIPAATLPARQHMGARWSLRVDSCALAPPPRRPSISCSKRDPEHRRSNRRMPAAKSGQSAMVRRVAECATPAFAFTFRSGPPSNRTAAQGNTPDTGRRHASVRRQAPGSRRARR